jgi:hypothetical protein
MKKAIVTLLLGKYYQDLWNRHCRPDWTAYANRHSYDIVTITKPIDVSARAQGRSPAWQKCLVLDPRIARDYERMVWIDADVMIRPDAPDVADGVPLHKIGVVDETEWPTSQLRRVAIEALADAFEKQDRTVARNWRTFLYPPSWHAFYGLPARHDHIAQTGVMVLSPDRHRYILEHVYRAYEDRGDTFMNYEMRPLSFEIQEFQLAHWIDPRFNACVFLPMILREIELRRTLTNDDRRAVLAGLREHTHFLHFTGPDRELMPLLDQALTSSD